MMYLCVWVTYESIDQCKVCLLSCTNNKRANMTIFTQLFIAWSFKIRNINFQFIRNLFNLSGYIQGRLPEC